jgi:hypothetical protein
VGKPRLPGKLLAEVQQLRAFCDLKTPSTQGERTLVEKIRRRLAEIEEELAQLEPRWQEQPAGSRG